jgi:short-subunit dehydrogenase
LSESSDKLFYETLDINFRSIFIFSREFSKAMIDNRWGRIVNIGSASSYSGYNETSLYCASKHAVLGFSRSIHEELKDKNVRTFCISPSSTKSKMGLNTKGQDYSTFLEPEDVAEYVAFAISFESNIVTNEIFLKRMILR